MKKCLLFFFVLLPLISLAKSFELGLNAGYNFSKYSDSRPYDDTYKGWCISAKGMMNLKHFQLGIGEDIGTLSAAPNKYSGLDFIPEDHPPKMQDHLARPYSHTYLFANYVFKLKRLRLYAGVDLGYIIYTSQRSVYRYPDNNKTLPLVKTIEHLYTHHTPIVGAQAGASYDISKHLSVNAEINPKTMGPFEPYIVAMTAGVRWRM